MRSTESLTSWAVEVFKLGDRVMPWVGHDDPDMPWVGSGDPDMPGARHDDPDMPCVEHVDPDNPLDPRLESSCFCLRVSRVRVRVRGVSVFVTVWRGASKIKDNNKQKARRPSDEGGDETPQVGVGVLDGLGGGRLVAMVGGGG